MENIDKSLCSQWSASELLARIKCLDLIGNGGYGLISELATRYSILETNKQLADIDALSCKTTNEKKYNATRNTFVNAGWYSINNLESMIAGVKAKRKDSYQYVRYEDV